MEAVASTTEKRSGAPVGSAILEHPVKVNIQLACQHNLCNLALEYTDVSV